MKVLIVEPVQELGRLWQRHLERQGAVVTLVQAQEQAIEALRQAPMDVIVLNLVLQSGGAFATADYASYRQPDAQIIFVTDTTFFLDGSIFRYIPNACAFVQCNTPPEDLACPSSND